jgi:YebC/PmpR family DNA-binding regulatory protein
MSGHSKWSSIKHKKALVDARRGKAFTKLIRELTSAAKAGGGSPEMNPRLRTAVAAAKNANMPADTIQRAIKKGTGELPGEVYEEVTYEGYGAGGVAVLVDVLTDNRNRTVAEIRHLFSKHGGNLGESGCVAWMFGRTGLITLDVNQIPEDELLELVLEAGGDDVGIEGDVYEIRTSPEAFEDVRAALETRRLTLGVAEITMLPQNTVPVEGKHAEQVVRLMEALDDHDDVRKAYANFDIPDAVLAELTS